ncbi:MAG: hypothetical protein ACU0DW_06565 [Shimia sp.]
MKHVILTAALVLGAGTAQAACFADYKAKRDNPLQLHYGVAEIAGPCTAANAEAQLPARLATDGWELLSIVSLFDEADLQEKRENAADFFLRY